MRGITGLITDILPKFPMDKSEKRPSVTAEVVCLFRALDYAWNGEYSILGDRYARLFLTMNTLPVYHLFESPASHMWFRMLAFGLYDAIIQRHLFMDRLVEKYARSHQILILGAGYDSRAWRFRKLINGKLIEIDFPATQMAKRRVLNRSDVPQENILYVPIDFIRHDLGLVMQKFNIPRRPTVVIWEGNTMYLSEKTVGDILYSIGKYFGSGTILAADYWHRQTKNPAWTAFMSVWPWFMNLIFREPLLFGPTREEFHQLAKSCGVKRITSWNGMDLIHYLNLYGYRPFYVSSVSVMEY